MKIKYPSEINNEESNKKILSKEWNKYDKETYIKPFKPSILHPEKATLMALTFSHYIPPVHIPSAPKAPPKNTKLNESIKERKNYLPTSLL